MDHHAGINPLVKIGTVVWYPIQHCVAWPDRTRENAPLKEGTVCRMALKKVYHGRTYTTYEESLEKAIRVARTNAKRAGRWDIDEILARHEVGDIRAVRAIWAK